MPTLRKKNLLSSPEIRNQDFDLWDAELLEIPILQRRLGRAALEGIQINAHHNHDPLAHVWQLVREGDLSSELVTKFKTEFIPDIGERSPDMGFYHIFTMHLENDDIVSATGVSMKSSIAESIRATEIDARHDERRGYGLLRERVQQQQIDQIIKWASSERTHGFYGFASLCPGVDELSAEIAKVNGFKPERQMASIWLYEKNYKGLAMHALSLDHCTPERFQKLMDICQVNHSVKSSTIEELGNPIQFDSVDIDEIKQMWKEVLRSDGIDTSRTSDEANNRVATHPETFQLYMRFVVDVSASLARGMVNKNLAGLLKEARKSDGSENASALNLRRFRRFGENDARSLMEFVRSRMIPHYIYGTELTVANGSASDVLGVAGDSASRVESYDGACPTSNFESKPIELSILATSGLLNRQLVVDALMTNKRKGSCLTCGHEQTTVYGCGLCTRCNKVWCDEYRATGRGLEIRELLRKVPRRNEKNKSKTRAVNKR